MNTCCTNSHQHYLYLQMYSCVLWILTRKIEILIYIYFINGTRMWVIGRRRGVFSFLRFFFLPKLAIFTIFFHMENGVTLASLLRLSPVRMINCAIKTRKLGDRAAERNRIWKIYYIRGGGVGNSRHPVDHNPFRITSADISHFAAILHTSTHTA